MPPRPYKRPISVLVLISTRGGETLLMERASPRGFWQSVTGSLREEEAPAEAAVRELQEETGLQAVELVDCGLRSHFPILPQWRARYDPAVRYNLEYVFRLELPARRPVRLNPAEHCAVRWLGRAEAVRLASSWTNRIAIGAYVPPETSGC